MKIKKKTTTVSVNVC